MQRPRKKKVMTLKQRVDRLSIVGHALVERTDDLMARLALVEEILQEAGLVHEQTQDDADPGDPGRRDGADHEGVGDDGPSPEPGPEDEG